MEPEALFAVWSQFPIEQRPRPIVLLQDPVTVGERGFVSNEAKLAWLTGAITARVPVPEAVLARVARGGSSRVGQALTITAVARTDALFECDRGPRRLPAFRLTVDGMYSPCLVLDPDLPLWWPPAEGPPARRRPRAEMEPDQRTVHFPAFGGELTEFRHAEFVEHDTYVIGNAVTRERRVPPGTAVHAVGISAFVTGKLTRALGDRVLVDSRGLPLAAISHTR